MKAKFVTRPSYQLQVSRWDGFSGLGLGQPVSEVGNCKAWVYKQDLGFAQGSGCQASGLSKLQNLGSEETSGFRLRAKTSKLLGAQRA